MAGVILILGLIAAGLYSGAWGFYLAAGTLGVIYLILQSIIAGLMATVKTQLDNNKASINLRKRN